MNLFLLTVDSNDLAYQLGFIIGVIIWIVLFISVPLLLVLSIFRYVKTKRKRWLVTAILSGVPVVLFLMTFLATFCFLIYKEALGETKTTTSDIDALIPEAEAVTYKTVPMDQESVSIDIPDYWEIMQDLNEDAFFQAGDPVGHEYMIALQYDKTAVTAHLGVISDFLNKDILANMEDPVVVSVERTMIDGMDAYQYEITGVFEDLNIAYLQTVIESSEAYLHILAWTSKADKEMVFPVFRKVVTSICGEDS